MARQLTLKQQRVLDFIKTYIHDTGFPPTVREIAAHLGLAGPHSAKKFLDILERKGVIRRKPGMSRALELVNREEHPAVRMVPVVGTVRAGAPELAVEQREGTIAVDASLARSEGMFFLRVRGDSMIEAHIQDGDLALVRPQRNVESGEIAAVLVGEEATVKYFFKERQGLRLQPAHPEMQPIRIKEGEHEVRIIGKVVAIFRELEKGTRRAVRKVS